MKKLWSLLCLVVFAAVACDDDSQALSAAETDDVVDPMIAEEENWADQSALESSPGFEDDLPEAVAEEGCACGNFIDEDGDGLCDLAATGQCRRARTGRCPCGSSCAGGC